MDGAREFDVKVKISQRRFERRTMRAMPGTFEWKYGRDTADQALYEAGSKFARLWERASNLGGASVDLSGQGGGGDWKGLPDGRAAAMDEMKHAMLAVGKMSSARITDYCVLGLTSTEIANKHAISQRDIAPVLLQDLRAVAFHFRFL